MESAGTQTGSTESSRKGDPDLVLADNNTPPADGDDCNSACVLAWVCVHACVHACVCGNFSYYTCLMIHID